MGAAHGARLERSRSMHQPQQGQASAPPHGAPNLGPRPKRPSPALIAGLVLGAVVVLVGLVLLLRSAAHAQQANCAAAVEKARATTNERGLEAARPDVATAKTVCKSLRAEEIAALEGKPTTTGTTTSTAPSTPIRGHLERACGVSRALTPRYTVRSKQQLDIAQAHRLKVLVTVPRGLSREELDAQVRHAALTAYEARETPLGALTVSAWAGDSTDGPFSAAMATFAPHGAWKDASESVPVDEWAVTTEFADGYFAVKSATLVPGATVVLGNDDDGPPTVLVSKSPTSWTEEDAVVRVPRGTKARVLSVRELNSGAGRTTLRYEVELIGSKKRGFIHPWNVRPE